MCGIGGNFCSGRRGDVTGVTINYPVVSLYRSILHTRIKCQG